MVLASIPVASLILFDARPVGAARSTFMPEERSAPMMAFVVVVFPVPGPPVSTITFDFRANLTASSCVSS